MGQNVESGNESKMYNKNNKIKIIIIKIYRTRVSKIKVASQKMFPLKSYLDSFS